MRFAFHSFFVAVAIVLYCVVYMLSTILDGMGRIGLDQVSGLIQLLSPAIFIVSKFKPKLDVNVQIMVSVYCMCVREWLLQEFSFLNANI